MSADSEAMGFPALFGELKGILGRPFWLAGVMPAAVLIIGSDWYLERTLRLEGTLQELLRTKELAYDAFVWLLSVLGLGTLFFAARGVVAYAFQTVPRPLRRWRIARQILRRNRAARDVDMFMSHYTVLKSKDRGFQGPKDLPDFVPIPTDDRTAMKALNLSRVARDALVKTMASRGAPLAGATLENTLGRGLLSLYSVQKQKPNAAESELNAWRELCKKEPAVKILDDAADEAFRLWEQAYRRLSFFPEAKFIRPTDLGNRAEALDAYALGRYGIDTSTMWSRLRGILKNEERKGVDNTRVTVEILLNLAVVFAVQTITIAIRGTWVSVAALLSGRWSLDGRTWLFLMGGVVCSVFSYRAAVYSFAALSEEIMRLVDIRRIDLLLALGFNCPATVGDERKLFAELRDFFVQGAPLDQSRPLRAPPQGKPDPAKGE